MWVPLARRAIGRAALVVTDTEAVRQELTAHGLVTDGAVRVIRPGTPPLPPPQPPPEAPEPGGFLLFVGTLEERKQPWIVVAVSRALDIPVVLVGGRDARFDASRLSGPGASLVGRVPDPHLAWYYDNCLALLAPSEYEGFDFPVVEGASRGARVVASDTPVHREVAPEATNFFDVGDIESATAATLRSIAAPRPPPVTPVGWADAARRYVDVYEEAAGLPR